MLYSDDRDYSSENSFNIDIEIWDVTYIGIPTSLDNIEIKEIAIDLLPPDIDKDLCKFNRKIFEIISDNKKYYIISGGLLIATNHWDREDRIFNYNLNLQHDKIIFSTNAKQE
ncbi:hypothetical protein EAH81_11030 [Flavobacterium pectinovorum]|uniref:Uncharacterized protein n=2 Tax=Flavobacterium pectinovorum TaxID=29533 RepID=A0A502ETJ0_9FLAO|nr:hypothetical protein EAH81_11030 [Flavobacterium pectinovorum]